MPLRKKRANGTSNGVTASQQDVSPWVWQDLLFATSLLSIYNARRSRWGQEQSVLESRPARGDFGSPRHSRLTRETTARPAHQPRPVKTEGDCHPLPSRVKGISKIETQAIQASAREVNKGLFLAVLWVAVFGAMNSIMMLPALLVEISTDLGVSVAVAGQLATATYAAWGVSVVSVGPLSDSFGRRPVALVGLLVVVGSLIGSVFAPNLAVFMALRVVAGLGAGTLPPTFVGAIAEVISPEKRSRAVGSVLAAGMLASVVSVPAVALLAEWGGWRFAFLVSGLLSASGFVTSWLWFPRDNKKRVRELVIFSRYWSLIVLHFFQVALTVNLAHRVVYWAMVSFFAAYVIHTYEVSLGFVALPLAIAAVGQVIGSYAGGVVATAKHRAILILLAGTVGSVCGFIFFGLELQLWVAVAVATVGTGFLSIGFPALVSASTEYSGDSTATGVGLFGLTNQLGGVLGAAVAGVILATSGYSGISYLCLGAGAVSVLVAGAFAKQMRIRGG